MKITFDMCVQQLFNARKPMESILESENHIKTVKIMISMNFANFGCSKKLLGVISETLQLYNLQGHSGRIPHSLNHCGKWLVETAFRKQSCSQSNAVLHPAARFRKSWLVTIYIFRLVIWSVLAIRPMDLIFLLSSLRFQHEESDFQHGSFQKICEEKLWPSQGLIHGDEILRFL